MSDKLFTYTIRQDQLDKHPDQAVVKRLVEASASDCTDACKIYKDPQTTLRLLVHRCPPAD